MQRLIGIDPAYGKDETVCAYFLVVGNQLKLLADSTAALDASIKNLGTVLFTSVEALRQIHRKSRKQRLRQRELARRSQFQ